MREPPEDHARTAAGASMVTDEKLVQGVVEGRPEALDALYERYGRPAYALAKRITGDTGFAEDVVQEVFLTLWRAPERFDRARGTFASWLLSVTHHKAVDAVRREETLRRKRAVLQHLDAAFDAARDNQPPVDEQVATSLRRERVRAALRELPEPQRQALALAYFEGYTQREVAALTQTPLGTVKTRMVAGMRRLATALTEHVDEARGDGR